MATCDVCGRESDLPYQCNHCGGVHCADHRLPEKHNCLDMSQWNDPGGVFDSGFDDSVRDGGRSGSRLQGLFDTGPGGVLGYFRGNMTFVFLAVMFLMFGLQFMVAPLLGIPIYSPQWMSLFALSPENPLYVWTWFTSIFAHGGFTHLLVNAIVIYFFGQLVEDYAGSRDYSIFFIVSGVVAGFAQIGASSAFGDAIPVLGASGAGLAIMGAITVLNPNLRVLLFFFIPMRVWILTVLYAVFTLFAVGLDPGLGGIGHVAHLVGLVIGLGYGKHLQSKGVSAPNQIQFGGPGGPGGPGGGRRRF